MLGLWGKQKECRQYLEACAAMIKSTGLKVVAIQAYDGGYPGKKQRDMLVDYLNPEGVGNNRGVLPAGQWVSDPIMEYWNVYFDEKTNGLSAEYVEYSSLYQFASTGT